MELTRNQLVVFEDGHKAGYLEAFWSNRRQAFCYVSDQLDEDGNRIKYFSTTVIEKPVRESKKFVPSKKSCPVQIYPLAESEKAYQIEDGTNGLVGRSSCKEYYKWVAKSVCYVDENGNIFAPMWAMN